MSGWVVLCFESIDQERARRGSRKERNRGQEKLNPMSISKGTNLSRNGKMKIVDFHEKDEESDGETTTD
jgi:hypothetical protein